MVRGMETADINPALQARNLDVAAYIVEKKKRGAPTADVVHLARNGDLAILTTLVEAGAPVGTQCIEAAADHGHMAIVQYLLNKGVPTSQVDLTPTAMAGHIGVLKMFPVSKAHETSLLGG